MADFDGLKEGRDWGVWGGGRFLPPPPPFPFFFFFFASDSLAAHATQVPLGFSTLTEPVLDRLGVHNARGDVSKDHDEGDGLAAGEALGQGGQAEVRVRGVGGADAGGAGGGRGVDVDVVVLPVLERLVPGGLVEGVRVAKVAVLTTVVIVVSVKTGCRSYCLWRGR